MTDTESTGNSSGKVRRFSIPFPFCRIPWLDLHQKHTICSCEMQLHDGICKGKEVQSLIVYSWRKNKSHDTTAV